MEVTNNTDNDVKYRVTGTGGSGVGHEPHHSGEETWPWSDLPPGECAHHAPRPPGPWMVCFLVNGRQVLGEVRGPAEQVRLVARGGRYRVETQVETQVETA